MCKPSKIWAHQKLFLSQTETCRRTLDEPMTPKRRIQWCPMRTLSRKLSCKLQRIYKRKHSHSCGWNNTLLPQKLKYRIHSSRSNICSRNQKKKIIRSHKCRARATHKPASSANQRYTELKNIMKSILSKWELGSISSQPCLLKLNNGYIPATLIVERQRSDRHTELKTLISIHNI
jgi:hypothetical protein